jgi:ATP-dependent Clp protease adaptor protein ClpS
MIQPVCEQPASTPGPASTPPQSDGTATAVATRPAPTKPKLDQLPPYRVLLHNDPITEMGFVITSIVELTPLNHERAVQVMLEAHNTGLALVLVTHKERAELYQEQFHSKKMTVTIEPAE